MAQPELKDGDGGDDADEFDIDFIPDAPLEYYWTRDPNEIRRAFILDKLADPSIDGRILIENMQAVFSWLTTGDVPSKPKKSHLKPVSE